MSYTQNVPVIDAVMQFNGTNVQECLDFADQWFSGFPGETATYDEETNLITTARGYQVSVTDWMVGLAFWGIYPGGYPEIVNDALFHAKYTETSS